MLDQKSPRASRMIGRFCLPASLGVLVAICGLPVAASTALAQPAGDEESGRTAEEELTDFIHFIFVANYDAAAAVGFDLLSRGVDPIEFASLVEASGDRDRERFERAIAIAMRVPELEPVAAEIQSRFEEGKLAQARHPDEIGRNIELLKGGLRPRSYGRERLLFAGEYAMPQLLEVYLTRDEDPALRAQVQRVIVDMGRQAVIPLATALPGLDPTRQEAVSELLGLIPYRTSLPFLTELHQETTSPEVRAATARAINRLGGDPNDNVASLFASLAEGYYDERIELTSFEGEPVQLLWSFNPALGLEMQPISTEVAHEAMAMRMAQKSLTHDADSPETIALWVASNYSREIDSNSETYNPAYGADRRPASYYAIASGASTTQRVLRRAIDDRDTPLALRSIDAIQRTAGSRLLTGDAGVGRRPLLEALTYPSRRVQFESAIALGLARPSEVFDGHQRVVPLLASAVENASSRSAIVLTGSDREQYDRIASELENLGYNVLPPAPGGLGELSGPIAELPGVDLMVTVLSLDETVQTRQRAAGDQKLAATPMLALMRSDELEPARRRMLRDELVGLRRTTITGDEIAQSAESLVEQAAGGRIDEDEAASFADRSLEVLRDLAISENSVLNVNDAAAPLIRVLEGAEGDLAFSVAEVLSHVGQERAQLALAEWALNAEGDDRLGMLEKLANSGKRHGNLLTDRLERSIMRLATSDDQPLATTAVATLGALGIEVGDLVPLILGDDAEASALVNDRR